jgi:putative spermidine/putrescine transport system ATP-binding protein
LAQARAKFFVEPAAQSDDKQVVLEGTLRETVFQGESEMAIVALEDSVELALRFGTGATAAPSVGKIGDKVSIGLHRKDIILIPKESAR